MIFIAPQDIICLNEDIKSCYVENYDLSPWEMKALTTIKKGTYNFKYNSLKATTPNNPYYLPIKIIYKHGNYEIELSYKHLCINAFMQLGDAWQNKNEIAHCTSHNVRLCQLNKI